VDWLVKNRPPEPTRLSVCHGDFHALNLLVEEDQVTGVLDWPGFAIADPVFDIANTIVLTTIPAKHLTSSMDGFSSVDWEYAAELYLAAYQFRNPADLTHVNYYKIRRCVLALVQGFEGQRVWQHPGIVGDLVDFIQKTTDIKISIPEG
jgi:aminoglycoside phosphotransferase (APT) family kinase protein